MLLAPLTPTDTRFLFRPVSSELVVLLRSLPPEAWQRPTLAGSWAVRDVVAHLVDLTLRRVSFHRDGHTPPPPPFAIQGEADFVRFINVINHEWVSAAGRLSPATLTELFELASGDLAEFFERLSLDAPALFGVSWAGEQSSEGWFDVGREFTELWHHQMQIRLAVGAAPLEDARYLRAVLDVAVRGLPHAYRDVRAAAGETVAVEVDGPSGGRWTLTRDPEQWVLSAGVPASATARVRVSDDAAWKLLFNALPAVQAASLVQREGREDLTAPLLRARSVVV
jgi:uncharacterized protein (TIGR03083 family)